MSVKTNSDKYQILITSDKKWFELNLKEVWQYKDLILLFTKRNFTVKYTQTILGPLWIFINPFITSVMYTLIFGNIANIETDGIPHLLFYLTSSAIWGFFAECVNNNSRTFTGNAGVFGKVYFPRLTVPISNILSCTIRFFIQMIMITFFLIYYVYKKVIILNLVNWLLIPFVLIHLGILSLGIGIIISSLTTKYRDLSFLVGFGVQLWMYGTPIVYPLSQISEKWLRQLVLINPVTMPVEVFRYAILGQGTIFYNYLILSWIIAIICAVLGIMLFNRVEKTFMDTV